MIGEVQRRDDSPTSILDKHRLISSSWHDHLAKGQDKILAGERDVRVGNGAGYGYSWRRDVIGGEGPIACEVRVGKIKFWVPSSLRRFDDRYDEF